MKHVNWLFLLFLTGGLALLMAVPGQPTRSHLWLEWDYPPEEMSTNLTFRIYSSADLNEPMTNWVVFAEVAGTTNRAILPIHVGRLFFAATASNRWGESDFSNVVESLPPPRDVIELRVW